MNNYKLTMDIEPIDKYEKAKKDLVEALKSVQGIPSEQIPRLIFEAVYQAFGQEAAERILQKFQ